MRSTSIEYCYAKTDSPSSLASLVRARSHRRKQRLQPDTMPNDSASHLSDPLPAPPHLGREDAVDRSSRGSNTSSVPSMVDDHGSDVSVDDDQYYRTSGEQIWDTFWQSGCGEDPEDASSPAAEEPSVSTSYQYPALVTPSPSLSLQPQQFITSRKRPTQTQSLGVIEAPAYAPEHKRLSEQTRIRRRGIHPCRVSYSIFPPPPKTDLSRQRTVRPKRCPPHLTLDTPRERISSEGSPPRQSLRNSASARNLRSGSASSAFSAFSAVSDASVAESDHTAFTTPSASPRESWDTCPRTPKPKHVSQCLDYRKLGTKQSLPNLRSSYRPVVAPRSATAEDFALGQARNSRVVGTVASVEPYPRPLFAPPVVAPLPPARRAPLPPVSERLPPPRAAGRQKGGGSALFGRMLSWKRND
ncbi:hypothetical protein GE09DRAFT_86334 [Coniochaeta sp. 2T2.1]|nr:hypothetical protein GE09DRAFT_86334 [Coniochaeta sp. 2T2.1]